MPPGIIGVHEDGSVSGEYESPAPEAAYEKRSYYTYRRVDPSAIDFDSYGLVTPEPRPSRIKSAVF